MAQQRAERPNYTFSAGLNTDAPLLEFPPNFTTDEVNFELMLDGTRRKRRGLEEESDDAEIDTPISTGHVVRTFKWRSVANNPDLNFHVWQIGGTLYFADDVPTPTSSMRSFTFDLGSIQTIEAAWSENEIASNPVDMAFGRGHALLVGKCIQPSYLEYDEDTDSLSYFSIDIRERDFQGVEDGYPNTEAPAELTDPYLYNLLNQGWLYQDILTYMDEEEFAPTKNMIPWMGYRREEIPGFNPDDGTKQFSPDKLINELFQDAPAPRGHFIRNPFDTTIAIDATTDEYKNYMLSGWPKGTGDELPIGMVPVAPNDLNMPNVQGQPNPAITLVEARFSSPLGVNVGDTISFYLKAGDAEAGDIGRGPDGSGRMRKWGHSAFCNNTGPDSHPNGQGPYIVEEVVDDRTIRFNLRIIDEHPGFGKAIYPGNWPHVYTTQAEIGVGIDGEQILERPTAVAFFAGRAVFSGIPHPKLGDAIFFSQVVEVDEQYGKCYQVADPTDENISDLVATDGLVIRIPEMGRVRKIHPYSSSLIVYASNGVWEIGAGAAGYFTADSYSIRKITDVGCESALSVVLAENLPVYWGRSGIFAITQDTNTGYLTAGSISVNKIDNLYKLYDASSRATATGDFDEINKRIFWVFQVDEGGEDLVSIGLAFDTKFGAFTPWRFSTRVHDIFTTTDYEPDNPSTLRFICTTDFGATVVATASSTTFADFGRYPYVAYLVTGYDTASTPGRYKYAPVITSFMKRETPGDPDSLFF